ncbi:uncharacterized protein N7483_009202 [Penicillium malachiteum]|uniref:uncharacterized protein n=1 Tax=Penicillium malachiteum TaxID=1324776 RepID=UPI002547278E|nr:uncharacterized protein N7483_009202 [Penicillium malachiteum]KAJ5721268.1 hypothetical protein N7483_009202 [Penicillium malachiteum]
MVRQQQDSYTEGSPIEMAPTTQNPNGKNKNPGSNPGIESKPEPDYFTLSGTSQPSAAVVDNPSDMPSSTNHHGETGEAITGNGDYLHGEESNHGSISNASKGSRKHMTRGEFDQFVGENELGDKDGKVGVQQFFGLESSY